MYIVARLNPLLAKNVPQRNRCGFKFTHQPSVADVTESELKILQADQYIKICNFPSVAWFEAMGIERTQVTEDKFRDKDGKVKTLMPENHKLAEMARICILVGQKAEDAQKATETGSGSFDGGSKGGDANNQGNSAPAHTGDATGGDNKQGDTIQSKGLFGKVVELTVNSPKEELIAALVRKRKKPGEDFNPDAAPEALFKLLKSL